MWMNAEIRHTTAALMPHVRTQQEVIAVLVIQASVETVSNVKVRLFSFNLLWRVSGGTIFFQNFRLMRLIRWV